MSESTSDDPGVTRDVDLKPSQAFSVSWRTTGIVALVVGTGSLTSLVLVASIKSVNILATVALALAVVTLTAQIVIFLGQFVVTAQQTQRDNTVYTETQGILTRIENQADSIHVMVTQHYDKLLDKVIAGTNATVEAAITADPEIDIDTLKERIATELSEIVSAERSSAIGGSPRRDNPTVANPGLVLKQWPGQSVLETLASEGLRDLSPNGQNALVGVASQHIANVVTGATSMPISLPEDGVGSQELVDVGVLQTTPSDNQTFASPQFRLTIKGRAAVRLITADPPTPQSVAQLFPWLPPLRERLVMEPTAQRNA